MSDLKRVQDDIRAQWDNLINKGIIPVIEFQTANDDYLLVDITLNDDNEGLIFSFDKDRLCDTSFSDEIDHVIGNNYQLTIDEYCDDLDIYLQQINNEMLEGYLLPNNLYYCE